jgi:hypothetical protein
MDGTKVPVVAWTHIIDDNWSCIYPVTYGTEHTSHEKFTDRLKHDAQIRLEGALKKALNRVHAIYRTAVPHWYKNELHLFLSLCIHQDNISDLVLTISRVDARPPKPGLFSYIAKTILTLDMAYVNTRLVARPEKDWLLLPATITETDDEFEDK